MREEEALLDDIHRSIPAFWAHTSDSLSSEDTIRLTQAVRLHCAEHFVRLLIYRHRFSEMIAERTKGPPSDQQTEAERAALLAAQNSAIYVIAANVNIANRGLMTYCTSFNFLSLSMFLLNWRFCLEHRRSPRYSSINPSRKDSSCGVTELQDRDFATFDTSWT